MIKGNEITMNRGKGDGLAGLRAGPFNNCTAQPTMCRSMPLFPYKSVCEMPVVHIPAGETVKLPGISVILNEANALINVGHAVRDHVFLAQWLWAYNANNNGPTRLPGRGILSVECQPSRQPPLRGALRLRVEESGR